MRTTLTLDDDLLQKAQRISGVNERGPLIHEALLALVQRESARRLAALGASDPELTDIHRRQPSRHMGCVWIGLEDVFTLAI